MNWSNEREHWRCFTAEAFRVSLLENNHINLLIDSSLDMSPSVFIDLEKKAKPGSEGYAVRCRRGGRSVGWYSLADRHRPDDDGCVSAGARAISRFSIMVSALK